MNPVFRCGRFELSLERPLVMGIVNVTPDSFSDGSLHFEPAKAIAHAESLLSEGADILDIGGESTRPGAQSVPEHEELHRVLPVVRAMRDAGVPLSIDTFKPAVMRRVLDEGADMINDIYGFRQPGAIQAVAGGNSGLCLMHMLGEPRTMQQAPAYGNVVTDVGHFLCERARELMQAGIARERLMLDPGFGFGKTPAQNYQLLQHLRDIPSDGLPWLIGVSRKSMIGHIVGRDPAGRLAGSLAAALAAVQRGAAIVRVHDVAATVDALKVWSAVNQGVPNG